MAPIRPKKTPAATNSPRRGRQRDHPDETDLEAKLAADLRAEVESTQREVTGRTLAAAGRHRQASLERRAAEKHVKLAGQKKRAAEEERLAANRVRREAQHDVELAEQLCAKVELAISKFDAIIAEADRKRKEAEKIRIKDVAEDIHNVAHPPDRH